MRLRIKITPVAFADIKAGADYYKRRQPALGKRFKDTVKDAFEKIRSYPFASSISYDDIRYHVVAGFPYVILYRAVGNLIIVTRVFNTHREPLH